MELHWKDVVNICNNQSGFEVENPIFGVKYIHGFDPSKEFICLRILKEEMQLNLS